MKFVDVNPEPSRSITDIAGEAISKKVNTCFGLVRGTITRLRTVANFVAATGDHSNILVRTATTIIKDGRHQVFSFVSKRRVVGASLAQKLTLNGILPRVISFSSVGAFVAVTGLALQYVLVSGLSIDKHIAYFIQSIVSIELNFFINNFFTWRDRRAPGIAALGKAWLRFHTVRVFTVAFNQMLYAVLLYFGIQYLFANILCTLIIMTINYWSGDKFIFAAVSSAVSVPHSAVETTPSEVELATGSPSWPSHKWLPRRKLKEACPPVSIVIPVKQSERTIEATVASLLQQEYAGPMEIIVVGDKGDSTWIPLRPYIDAGLVTIVETVVQLAHHDLNAKRNAGLQVARGQVIALVENDMLLPMNWLATGVNYVRHGWPCVVGSVKSLHDDLTSAYVAAGRYYSNGSAQYEERVIDMERLGAPGYQLPITSNIFLSRDVLYYIKFPDPDFDVGYEGYQWHWEMARADIAVLSAPTLVAVQQNRRSWRQLLDEYFDSGQGCADFVLKYPQAGFSRRRLSQVIAITLMTATIGLLSTSGLALPDWPKALVDIISNHAASQVPAQAGGLILALLVACLVSWLLSLGIYKAWRIRHARGLIFPVIGILAGLAFTIGVGRGLARQARRPSVLRPKVRLDVVNVQRQSVCTPPDILIENAWSVSGPQVTATLPAVVRESRAPAWPSVSIIIPVKRSQATIAVVVESLLHQDYKGNVEILLVGDKDDPTWEPIRRHIDSGRVSIIEVEIRTANRDANAKRSIGLHAARGEILALTDSDMVLPPNWVSTGIEYILKGWPCVAGPMRGAQGGFWDSYADLVDLGSKTPRFGSNIIVDRIRFGQPYHKPPITANVLFTRTVLEKAGDFDPSFAHSYEDYSWFWTVCRAGLPIFCTPELIADHYHRQGWRQLIRQYTRAGRGCGDFVLKYPESPLSQGRLLQLTGVWTAILALVTLTMSGIAAAFRPSLIQGTPLVALASHTAILFGLPLASVIVMVGVLGLFALGARNALAVRRPVALIYPFITAVFAVAFSIGLTDILLRATKRWVSTHRAVVATGLALGGILCTALVLRLWNVTMQPGTEWDEPVYANVAWNMAHTGLPFLRTEVQHHQQVYFSQPPFYFALLALWYKVTNTTQASIIGQARVLSALMSVGMVGALFLLLYRRIGPWALVPTLLVAVDGWILFANRISWIDNTAIPIGIVGLWVYDRAMSQNRRRPFIVAGAILVAAVLFKYLAIYFCVAVAINWLITRQHRNNHVALAVTIAIALIGYVLIGTTLASVITAHGHTNTFIAQHLHQLLRTTNKVSSRGNVISVQQVLTALVRQYRVFIVTVGLCGLAGALIIADLVRCAIRRDLTLLRQHSLEASWVLAAFVVFGAVQIRFINYFAYMMIPLLVYLSVRTIDVIRPWLLSQASHRALVRAGLVGLLIAVVGLDLISFAQRIADRNDNTFVSVQTYAAHNIPAEDEVLTEQPIGTMIRQPYCQVTNISNCPHARWIILFVSLTERPPSDPQLQSLLAQSTLLQTYQGFKETIYVYQIRPTSTATNIQTHAR